MSISTLRTPLLFTLGLIAMAAPCWAGAAGLRRDAEAFAGQPVLIDPRIAVPECAGGIRIGWRDPGRRALVARCPATSWQMVFPVAAETASTSTRLVPLVRKGQPVTVMTGGNGFRVAVEGVAEAQGQAGGRVVVRNARSGRLLLAAVSDDGRLHLAGDGDGERK